MLYLNYKTEKVFLKNAFAFERVLFMKKFRKLTALILAVILTFSVTSVTVSAASAADSVNTAAISVETIFDLVKKIISLFAGSSNPQTDISFTVEQGEIFTQKQVSFDSAHASTVAQLLDGRLLSAWFGGSGEGNSDVRIWYSFYNDGAWSAPAVIETTDTVAHWNPVLQNFGLYVRLYYKVGKDTETWVTKYCDYSVLTGKWSSPKELVPGDTTGGRGPVKNKCLVTSKGVIIAPASTEQGDWHAFFDISRDGGLTWTKTDYVATPKGTLGTKVSMIQPTLWEDKDGVVHALFRTKSGYVYRSDSTDGGFTWCEAYKTSLPNNNSGIDVVMTDNGWLWLAYNPINAQGLRYKLMLAVSKDNGETWEDVQMLESSPLIWKEYSYPSLIADGNKIYMTYTYEREIIKYAFIEFEE